MSKTLGVIKGREELSIGASSVALTVPALQHVCDPIPSWQSIAVRASRGSFRPKGEQKPLYFYCAMALMHVLVVFLQNESHFYRKFKAIRRKSLRDPPDI
jgi:hypothetical protein